MTTHCIESTEGFYFERTRLIITNVAIIQSVNAFIGKFDIQKRAVPCFCRFTDPESVEKPVGINIQNNTWSRCPRDPTSVKCKVKVDSYKAWSRFGGRWYSFVRIWWKLTENWRTTRAYITKHHVSQEKQGRDLNQSYDKCPYNNRNVTRATWQHKDVTKKFDYTAIADRLRTVRWSNYSHPIGVVFRLIVLPRAMTSMSPAGSV